MSALHDWQIEQGIDPRDAACDFHVRCVAEFRRAMRLLTAGGFYSLIEQDHTEKRLLHALSFVDETALIHDARFRNEMLTRLDERAEARHEA